MPLKTPSKPLDGLIVYLFGQPRGDATDEVRALITELGGTISPSFNKRVDLTVGVEEKLHLKCVQQIKACDIAIVSPSVFETVKGGKMEKVRFTINFSRKSCNVSDVSSHDFYNKNSVPTWPPC